MTLKNCCEYIISASRNKSSITLQSVTAETLADILLEAIETMERSAMVIDVNKYPFHVSRIQNWLIKVNK